MDPDTFIQSVAALPDGAACCAVARRVHEVCGAGTRLMVGREYALAGTPGAFVACVSDAHGAGPQAVGTSERAALEALLRALGDFSRTPVD